MYVPHRCPESEEGVRSPGITDGCELLGGCWELNLGLLDNYPVLLISDPFLESHSGISNYVENQNLINQKYADHFNFQMFL